ncbi:apoptotic protease-activating factor 1 isoform X2 [Harpegnathos saltator]|uniref:apoptotic protease-activating factor 1 isoform X2 n=1 Tax=Harpegnathos saltator TaxID=610380 RepID=UPI000DBEF20E|nr:apoptotic protease-activating factor 1 isoform X2 [Harpegnathos saltator]
MENTPGNILRHLRRQIIADLDVNNGIISSLKSEFILNDRDIQNINAGADNEQKASILLDILSGCDLRSFDVFHQALKRHYEWLSDAIDNVLGNFKAETNGANYKAPSSIPPISPLSVTREQKLKNALQQLRPGDYITLHGMKGFGKSSLTVLTLQDIKLVTNLFACEIYWIKFICERFIDEEILIQLTALYHNVKNFETQPELFTPLKKDSLVRFLEHHFSKPEHQNALLVLDDVYDKKIINAFDFKCKTLILTTDIDVLDGRISKQTIRMDDGFTEAETLGLFAQVLNISADQLPPEAKKIHRECKGMPLLIAMFAAQFEEYKEEMIIVNGTRDRWKYYLRSLIEKDPKNKVIKKFLEKQETIFDMCIDQLNPELKEQYKKLAIFNEDVNITRKTLEIIWEYDDMFFVEQQMQDLCHKSLAAKKWNKDSKSYIYGVHDLLLSHLRKKLKPDELTQLHKSVIEQYRKYCNNDFSKLPNDNYIYSYIGYHLEQAKLYEEFTHLYLNLDFIQAKIIHSGLNDLLLDLKKYRSYITRNINTYEAYVSDLETFLQEQVSVIAEHRHKKCLDIVQIGMNHTHEGYIMQTVRDLAAKKQKYLYLSHDKKPTYTNMTLSEEVSSGICTSSFTDDPNMILTGYRSGKVVLWNCESKQQIVYNSHSNKISVKKIVVSAEGDFFLTLTDNGVVKLFRLYYDEQDHPYHVHLGSPKEKQKSWVGFFTNDNKQDDSLLELSIKNEIILDMVFGYQDKLIATCTDQGAVQIWNRNGEIVSSIKRIKSDSITKIAFTDEGTLLHVMNESKGSFYVYSRSSHDQSTYEYACCYNLQLQDRQVIYFHNVPEHDNSLMIVTTKRALYIKWNEQLVCNFKKQERAYVENDTLTFVCATITNDGKYLILADSGGFVNVWDTDVGYQPIAIYKNRVTSLDTYWFKDEYYHLICGTENSLLHRWKLPVHDLSSTLVIRKALFDAIVKPNDEMDIIVKENYTNHIMVLHGKTQIAGFVYNTSTEGQISNLQLFSDGSKVLYVMEKNSVSYSNKLMLFDIKSDKAFAIMESSLHPIRFVILNINNNDIIVCRETNHSLRVWQNTKVSYMVNNTGRVMFIHKLNDDHVITISQNGVILIWQIDQTVWQTKSRKEISNSADTNITFSCLSHKRTYLAISRESHDLILFTFNENKNVLPTRIEAIYYYKHNFVQKMTYCDISQDELYIAVGFETGLISIINIRTNTELQQLNFHNSSIKQLSWGPTTLDAPILLSLADDELAWWNVSLQNDKINVKKRSRMGIIHSRSTPSISANTSSTQQIPNSRSLESNLQHNAESNAGTANGINCMYINWKDKEGRNPEQPALLAVLELPQCRTTKVCFSQNFSKFLTVDIYGSVSIFKPFNHT